MTQQPFGEETRQSFDDTLDGIRRGTLELGALVLENTRRMSETILENRVDLAHEVVTADEEIDARYSDLEREVFEVLARQQPVAGDLRLLVSITRILYEIERSGDLAVNAAKGVIRREGYWLQPNLQSLLARMASATTDLFAKSLDALTDLDPTAGERLDIEDDVVDDLVAELYGAIGKASSEMEFELAVELSRVGRYMERIADHAVNIGEHVTFIVTGSFPADEDPAVTDEG